jgi:hypothetical protein
MLFLNWSALAYEILLASLSKFNQREQKERSREPHKKLKSSRKGGYLQGKEYVIRNIPYLFFSPQTSKLLH